MEIDSNVIETLARLAREGAPLFEARNGGLEFAIVPDGSHIASLKEYQYPHGLRPDRIIAAPKFQDATSFISYVNTFKDHRTRILADATTLTFRAQIDYHGHGADMQPEFLSHQATLPLKLSEEWKLWIGLNDRLVPQAEFAEFLEDNRADIIEPNSATMLEIAQDLQAHSEVNFASKINRRSGAAVLSYEETINTKMSTGSVTVPETFTINIPVFFGESPIEITARLRFRIGEGKLKFQYKLYRPVEVISKAFDAARGWIAGATEMEVLLGVL